ncbi:TraR/DksA C4-type zinc finger protein [Pseudomonas mosselii]|uniref:TraR/DksA C4-type zinc finger protein n=1 Tax=Pseudomonas TaxID=286 RepID=UPI00397DBFB1
MIGSSRRSSSKSSEASRACSACIAGPNTSTRPLGGRVVADIADLANDRAQWHLDLALAARKPAPVRVSLEECVDCDEPISQARRLAAPGCMRCTECQVLNEKQGARHAR